MKRAVFYDLETSDRLTTGQIINFSFVEVNSDFDIRSECSGNVKLTRLQLPDPEAALVTGLDAYSHQQTAELTEREALGKIWLYLSQIATDGDEPVVFVGYNSSRFDLPYLRTSFIRNGLNPYFGGRLLPYDLLHLVRRVYITRMDFPASSRSDDVSKLSLSLEAVTGALGLRDLPQAHEARADVILTIELAKILKSRFGSDILKSPSYNLVGESVPGGIISASEVCYDLNSNRRSEQKNLFCLDEDRRASLWVDLGKFAERKAQDLQGEDSLWYSTKSTAFLEGRVLQSHEIDERLKESARSAKSAFLNVKLEKYFPRSSCDVEFDIYRLDFQDINALNKALWERDSTELRKRENPDALELYDRHRIAYYQWGQRQDEQVRLKLQKYAQNRYGGQMRMDKARRSGIEAPSFHPTYTERMTKIESLLTQLEGANRARMEVLKKFYEESDIAKALGDIGQ